ncbi:pectate lyase [Luteolibacter sp. LG18]|nr:pectate lyase [Luteolibacter sp. LG18]
MLQAADWYVAPAGSDAGAGSLEKPFATVQRAQQAANPGDTVQIRGGTYRMKNSDISKSKGPYASLTFLDKSGTKDKPITYRAYRDEKPVFDCTDVKPPGKRVSVFSVTGSWLRLVGLEVTGVQVTITDHTQSICFHNNGSNNIYERLLMHDTQAIGIYSVEGSNNLFLNCDAWNNWDSTSEGGRGGNSDGFGCHPPKGSTGNVFRGCRAWFNSDDGFDCINARESVTFENCWAFYNGFTPDMKKRADGNGFKAGGFGKTPASELPSTIPRHTVRNCVAVGNKAAGFYANHQPGGGDWLNNSAYRNSVNYNMLCRLIDEVTDVDGYGHKLVNNLSYGSRWDILKYDASKCQASGNSFTTGLKLTDKDFVSLDDKELLRPRKPNGDLPDMGFLRPAPRSAIVTQGIGAFGK